MAARRRVLTWDDTPELFRGFLVPGFPGVVT